jgi:hypothetical protein
VAVLVLLQLAGGRLVYNRVLRTRRPDPVKAEAGFRGRMRQAGGEVRAFSHHDGPKAFYRAVVDKEGHRLTVDAWVVSGTAWISHPSVVCLDRPLGAVGALNVQVQCGGDAPMVLQAYRGGVQNEVTLPKEEEETCKRLAQDVFVALQDALK